MAGSCPTIDQIENMLNADLKKEGLETIEFAQEFNKITRSGKRYGGMRGGGDCSVADALLILSLVCASLYGGIYCLTGLSAQAMTTLGSATSATFQRGLDGSIQALAAQMNLGSISDLGGVLKNALAGVGAFSIGEWTGGNGKVKELLLSICANMNSFRTGESKIKWMGGRRRRSARRSRRAGTKRGGSCGSKIGGSRMSGGRRTRRRRSRAGTKRGGSCGAKIGGRRTRTRRRRAGSRR